MTLIIFNYVDNCKSPYILAYILQNNNFINIAYIEERTRSRLTQKVTDRLIALNLTSTNTKQGNRDFFQNVINQ